MTRSPLRLLSLIAAVLAAVLLATDLAPARARASTHLVSMFEDDGAAMQTDPVGTLERLRLLGVQVVRIPVRWFVVAPQHRPAHFNASDPASPGYPWGLYDSYVTAAAQVGIAVDLDVAGEAWRWAEGPGIPRGNQPSGHGPWEPNATDYGQFVHAVAERYSGSYTPPGASAPLPRVSFWSIWNEPDYGPSLAPQGLPGHLRIDYAPLLYRRLVDAAWKSLLATGHTTRTDTIIFGEVAPRGFPRWGVYSGMTPMLFLRSLYCVDSRYRPLRGYAARVRGCPTTAAGTRAFPRQHPALFQATGFSDHPYMRWYAPNHEPDPDPYTHTSTADYATLGTMGRFERGLDRLLRVYG